MIDTYSAGWYYQPCHTCKRDFRFIANNLLSTRQTVGHYLIASNRATRVTTSRVVADILRSWRYDMKEIPLTQGKFAIVDDEDFDRLYKWRWTYAKTGYAVRHDINDSTKTFYMHREIMNTAPGMETDHINHNCLDNRKINLRICTHCENQHNRRLSKNNTSGYIGINLLKGKWQARIRADRDRLFLGLFTSPEEAALAYDKKARELFGEFAHINFPIPGE